MLVRGATAQGTETTPATLDLNPAAGSFTQPRTSIMAMKKKAKKPKKAAK
jgi:hypothetical protein